MSNPQVINKIVYSDLEPLDKFVFWLHPVGPRYELLYYSEEGWINLLEMDINNITLYQIWLDAGYQGSRQDFLDWLLKQVTDAKTQAQLAAQEALNSQEAAMEAANAAWKVQGEIMQTQKELITLNTEVHDLLTQAIDLYNQALDAKTASAASAVTATNAAATATEQAQIAVEAVNNMVSSLAGKQDKLSGTGFVKSNGGVISYDPSTYALSDHNHDGRYWGSDNHPTSTAGYGLPAYPVVPTNLSAFNNDSGYLTSFTELDPTVPSWAKAPTKPSYTKSEVGLGNVVNIDTSNPANIVWNDAYQTISSAQAILWNNKQNALNGTGFVTISGTTISYDTNTYALSNHNHDEVYAKPIDITTAIDNLINSAPGTLDTLGEIATALGGDPNLAANLTAAINNRLLSSDFTTTNIDALYGYTPVDPFTLNSYLLKTDIATWAKGANKPTYNYSEIIGTPDIPAAQIQSDWNQTTTIALDYIKNKPTNVVTGIGTIGQIAFWGSSGITGDNAAFWDNTNKRLGLGTTTPSSQFTQRATTAIETQQLGSELLTTANWTTTGWTGTDPAVGFTHVTDNTTPLTNTIAAVSGNFYKFTFTITSNVTGGVNITFGGVTSTTYSNSVPSPTTWTMRAVSTGSLLIVPNTSGFSGTIIISLKQITSSSSPIYVIQDSAGNVNFEVRSSSASSKNTFIGKDVGGYNTTGLYNTAVGANSFYSNTEGRWNTTVGCTSLNVNTTGDRNSAFGYYALSANTTGGNNVAIGGLALAANTIGYSNSAHGSYALYSNTTGNNNTAVGDSALYSHTTGGQNTAIGVRALYTNTTANSNTAIGSSALTLNKIGSYNTATGDSSLAYNTASYNSGYGAGALYLNTTGNNNTTLGYYSFASNLTGSYNTAIGVLAGRYIADGLTNRATGDFDLYLGANTKAGSEGASNEIVIGYSAIGNGSNTATIGNSSILRTYLRGINIAAGSTVAGTAPLKFTGGALMTTPEVGAIEYNGYFWFTDITGRFKIPSITTGSTSQYLKGDLTVGNYGAPLYFDSASNTIRMDNATSTRSGYLLGSDFATFDGWRIDTITWGSSQDGYLRLYYHDRTIPALEMNLDGRYALIGSIPSAYTHPAKAWVDKTNLSGATVISNLTIDALGHPTDWTTRSLSPADIGAEPSFNKNTAFNKNFGTATGQVWGYDTHPSTLAGYGITDTPWTSYLPLSGGTLTGNLFLTSASVVPTTTGTGNVGTAAYTWNNGYFTNIYGTLNGTANNIRDYTVNQNLGGGDSPTFNGLYLNEPSANNGCGSIQWKSQGTQMWNLTTLLNYDFALYNNGGTNSYNLTVSHSTGLVTINSLATGITGLLKGNGASPVSAATKGNDYFTNLGTLTSNVDFNTYYGNYQGVYNLQTANGTGNVNYPQTLSYGTFTVLGTTDFTSQLYITTDNEFWFRTRYNYGANWYAWNKVVTNGATFDYYGYGSWGGGYVHNKVSIDADSKAFVGISGSNSDKSSQINFAYTNDAGSVDLMGAIKYKVTNSANNAEASCVTISTKSGTSNVWADEKLKIDNLGNIVSYGESHRKFSIPGVYNFENVYLGQFSGNGGCGLELINHSSGSNSYGMRLITDTDTYGNGLMIQYAGSSSTYAGLSYNTAIAILTNGCVGIGKTNPVFNLDVAGNGHFTSDLILGSTLAVDKSSGLQVRLNNTGTYYGGIGVVSSDVWALGRSSGSDFTPLVSWDRDGMLTALGGGRRNFVTFKASGTGIKWIRIPYSGQNQGYSPIHFIVTRSISDDGGVPYGGPSLEVKAQGREWHNGQQFLTAQYGYHGEAGAEITHVAIKDNQGGGYYIYLRLYGGVTYYFTTALDSGWLGTPEDDATGAPTASAEYSLVPGFNVIGDYSPSLNVAGWGYFNTISAGLIYVPAYSGKAQIIGNCPSSYYWGVGPSTTSADNTVRIGASNSDGSWLNNPFNLLVYGNLTTTAQLNAVTGSFSGNITIGGTIATTGSGTFQGGGFDSHYTKKNIVDTVWQGNATAIIKDTPIAEWYYHTDPDNPTLGPVIYENTALNKYLLRDKKSGINIYSMMSLSFKAIQEIDPRVKLLEDKIQMLEERIQKLEKLLS